MRDIDKGCFHDYADIDLYGGKRMKRFSLLCGMILGFIALFTSCNNPAQTIPSTASVWEISKNGNALFLGGSVHLLRAEDYPMPAAFDFAFDESEVLVLETDADRMSDPDMIQYQYEKFMLPGGQTLETVLDDAVYKQLENAIGDPGLVSLVSRFKPAVVINELQMLYLQQNGFTEDGADLYYLAKAKDEGRSLGFLEDVEIQIDMLGGMADGRENEYVAASLNGLQGSENEIIAYVSDWKAGTAAAIKFDLNAQKTYWPALYKTMVYDRNAAWIPKIENYLTAGPIEFVIVGLAHLHGQDGLLIQLKNKGYTIRQLVN
jgi:uncharacterized protein YbaP (TraB family)